jgi:hypothetical protein
MSEGYEVPVYYINTPAIMNIFQQEKDRGCTDINEAE